ncbi:hypothetical protein Poly24_49070 [Rosistilla carotiformis]|uniref:FecR protein domain-containing protein n=1 Tax=Rosistilla carotiformis TaxID=2528017 RepID=A0A518K045_9BACT|nr:hypothetical protein [Rosistilla carotiformis]QDV71173.1 hypothetical protein Poly24_49070 [Rosistilla carotiformis]
MRLTVRTLLAYLDHVLPEEANEALSAKLRDSPYATQLADKIKASIQRTDLGTPAVGAVHPIEDANTIAEYLDNVLPGERIPEVERVLLESDVHMSEAAACHQILTLVLSRPALVPHGLRDRIYQLSQGLAAAGEATVVRSDGPSLSDPSVASLDLPISDAATVERKTAPGIDAAATMAVPFRSAAATQPAPNGHPAGLSPRRPDVPEYLRAGRPSRILPWLMTLGLCAVLLFIIAKAFQPVSRLASDSSSTYSSDDPLQIERENMPAPGFGPVGESPGEVVVEDPVKRSSASGSAGGNVSAVEIPAADSSVDTPPPATGTPNKTDVDASAPPEPVDLPTATADSVTSESMSPAPAGSDAAAIAPTTTVPTVPEPNVGSTVPAAEPAGVDSAAKPAMSATGADAEPASPVVLPTLDPAMEPADAADSETEAAPAAMPKPVVAATQMGVLESGDTILVSRSDAGWDRVKKGAGVFSGTTLVNAPTFRSRILLADGVAMTSVGEAEFSFEPATDASPTINLDYGRFMIESATPDATVALNLAGRRGTLHLPTVESRAAIQVTVFRAPGADPTAAEAIQPVVAIQVLAGTADWMLEGIEEVSLTAPVRWSQVGTEEAASDLPEPPAWTKAPEANAVSIESMSRKGMLELIDATKTIEITLREAVGFRRAEVAALAARSLLMLGISDVYFGTKGIFENDAQRSHWQEHFVSLQSQLDRGGQNATAIRDSIARMNAAQAARQYRLLWGYSPAQLASGGDFELIEALNDGALTTRVLALENLREITGTTLNFRPQETGPRRAAAGKKWDTKLAAKDLRWEEPPAPLSVLER